MMYFTIALRNIRKNVRKNLLTLFMISFGIVALYMYTGSNSEMFRQFRDTVIHEQYGHFQLHAKGFSEFGRKDPYKYVINDYSHLEYELLNLADIDFVVPRLAFSGIASSDEKSTVIKGFGGMSAPESKMEYGKVFTGTFISESTQAIVGERMLAKVSSSIGETLTILSNMRDGGITAADFYITGTKKSYGESDVMNQMFILAGLKTVQNMLDMNDTVDTIIVHLKNEKSFSQKEMILANFCNTHGLEYQRWDALAVFYQRSREVFAMNENILTGIILIISIFIIINTLYMAYMSRIREIGTMRAMGTTKKSITLIIIFESTILSVLGCTLGVILAAGIAFVVNLTGGIYHPASVFNEEAFYTLIKPQSLTVAFYFILFMVVSLIASIVIAFRALQLSIADSLRWNG